jgi:hypothetical protein
MNYDPDPNMDFSIPEGWRWACYIIAGKVISISYKALA